MRTPAVNRERCRYFRYFVVLLFFLTGSTVAYAVPDTIRYTGSPNLCQGQSLLLTANPPGSMYQWQLNGTNVSTASSYTVNQSGTVTVSVNGTLYAPLVITVNPKPIPAFTFDNNGTCSGTTIQFNSGGTTGAVPLTYLWNFGDGSTSTLQNPAQPLTVLGCGATPVSISNTLTVTDANGCTNSITNPYNIIRAPDVSLADSNVFSPFRNCDNSPTVANPNYRLKVSNTSLSALCISSYTIDWGDGGGPQPVTAASFPIFHIYTQLGAFNLVFTGIGSNGCNHSKTYIVANQSNPAGGLGTLGATTGLCAPATIPFVISNWQGNSPGTTYLIDYGDGTNITLNHPLNSAYTPDTISHTYTTTSCPGSPTFTATLRAKNACDITPYTAGNIQVRVKPNPNFTYPTPACVSQPVTFTNTTAAGFYGPTCSTAAQYTWDFGDPASGPTNTSTSTNGTHTFSATGTYTVTLSANNPCGTAITTKQICIVAIPVPSFTVNNTSGCIPLTVNATNTSNTLTGCAVPTYTWTITYQAANCGTATTPIFTFANGTNLNSVNPSFLFSNPGIYTIRLTITSPCGTFFTTQVVSVKKPPTVTLPTYSNACDSIRITPIATVVNCGANTPTYLWTIDNAGTITTYPVQNPGSILFNTPGLNEIKVEVTNECGTTTAIRQFSIFPKPDINSTPNDTVCKGAMAGPYNFSSNITGTMFTWVNNNPSIGLAASGMSNIVSFVANTGTTLTTATIIATPVNGCSGTPDTFTITVFPIPPAPTVTSSISYCQNAIAVPLIATPLANHTLIWYTVANGGVGSTIAPTPSTATAGITNYYISQKNVGSCEGPRAQIMVTVNAAPVIVNATITNPLSCGASNGFITLTGLLPNTSYTVTYTKNGTPVTVTISSNTSNNLIIPNLTSGTYDNIKVTRLGCPSNTVGPFSLVDPNPPATPTAGSNSPVCSGSTINLTATTIAGATYTWSGPVPVSPVQNPTISNVTTAATGTYSVTVTVSGCTSAAGTTAVVVNPIPANVAVGSNAPICSGDTLKLTSSTTSAGSVIYAWTGPNSFSSNLQNPIIPNATVAASGTYSVIATLGSCSAAPKTVSVTIRPTPTITDSSFTNPITCTSASGTISLIGLANNTSYTVNYLKNGTPFTGTFLSNANGVVTILGLSAGTYSNITVTLNTCVSNSVGPFVLVPPNPPAAPVAGSNSPICIGGTINLTANTPGTATYNWIGPNNFTSSFQNPTITNATMAASGTYSVTATVNGCTSPPSTVTVLVSASAGTANAGPDQQLCNTSFAMLAGNSPGSATGAWTVVAPSTATIAQVNNPASVINNLPSGITKAVWTISNGICQPSMDTVQITNLPDLVNTISPLSTTVCSGQGVTITGAVPTGGSGIYAYQWQRSPDNIIFTNVPGAMSVSLTVSPTATTYYRRVVNAGPCAGSSDTAVVIVLAGITGNSISAAQSVCTNTVPALLTGSLPAGGGNSFTYTWEQSIDGGVTWSIIPGATGKDYQPNALTLTTRYRRTASTVLCGGTQVSVSNSITISITPGPTGTLLYNSGYLCPGTPLRMEVVSPNAPLIRYVFGNGDSLTTTNTIITYTYPQPGTYIPYAYIISGNCIIKLTRGDTVKVDRLRTGFLTQVQQACGSTTVSFADTSKAFFGIRTWRWDFGDSTFSLLQNPVKTYTSNGVYNVKLRITGNSNCIDSVTIPVTIVVHRKPTGIISGDTLVCIGQPLPLSASVQSSDPINSYNWDLGNGLTATGQNVNAIYNMAGTYIVQLISLTSFNCADTVYKSIRVNAAPTVSAGPDVTICRGQSVQLGAIGATTWQWSPMQNLSCTTCANPVANPLFTTSYIVTGSFGALCKANDTIQVRVIQPFNMTVSPTTTLCIGDSVPLFATGAYTYLWSPANSLSNPNISNPTAKPTTTTLYQVVGKDNFNCFTDTDYVRVNVGQYPTVDLGTGATVVAGTTITLNPTITNGPIIRYRWTPPTDLSCSNCPRPVATINNNITYQLEVTNSFGCTATDTIIFKVNCDPNQLFIPNAFSPDGDGTNDVLMVRGKGISAVKYFRVFNRWGELVFERSNINVNDPQQGWDGKINGVDAQPDVYVYTAEAVCSAGATFVYKGNVTLIR